MTSEIRTNSLKSRAGLSTVTLTDSGPIFSGITTFLDNSIFNVGNINATGVITATSFVGSGANLTGITGTTINNNANNRIITGSGTANTLEGEANLTWDGNSLDLTAGTGNQFPIQIRNDFTPNSQRADYASCVNVTSNNTLRLGSINSNGGVTIQSTRANDSSIKHNLILQPDGGKVGIGEDNPDSLLHISADSGQAQVRLQRTGAAANGNDYGRIYFESNDNVLTGQISVARESAENDGYMHFATASGGTLTERLRIASDGSVGINETSPQQQLHVHDDTTYNGILINGNAAPRIGFAPSTGTTGTWSAGIDGNNDAQFVINNSNNNSNRVFILTSSGVTAAGTLTSGGNATVGGNLILSTSGAGIDFSATGDASGSSSELLDDYEEGTWTPQVHDGTISVLNANYTKIGRQVTVVARIYNFSNNSTNDAIRIKNLPFAAAVTSVAAGSVMYSYAGQSNATVLYLDSTHNGSFNMYGGHSGAFDNLRHNELNISSQQTDMYIVATYFAAS